MFRLKGSTQAGETVSTAENTAEHRNKTRSQRVEQKQEESLVLFVDDDQMLSNTIGKFLSSVGYRVTLASNGKQALELLNELRPQLVIADLHMPVMSGLEFLEQVRGDGIATPVIVTTGYPEVETAIKAIQYGAFDYMVKPFQLELLHQKVEQAIKTNKLARENAILSELASLHEITSKLTNTHDLDELLDVTFKYCLEVSQAENGSVQLVDHKTRELAIVRKKGIQPTSLRSSLDTNDEWAVSKWVVNNGRPMLIAGGKTVPEADVELYRDEDSSSLSVPLRVADQVVGVVNLKRPANRTPFSLVDLNIIEVLASQAGIAINNAQLYASVNQKLDELSLISTYSEQLMGLIDKGDIVRCLYETVRRHFKIDVAGFLVVQKRRHLFLYWTRGKLADEELERIRKETIEYYNRTAGTQIPLRRVSSRMLMAPADGSGALTSPLGFNTFMPVAWENFNYGTVYFGAMHEPDNCEEKISLLSGLMGQTRIALTNSKLYGDMKENYIRTIKALAIAVDAKDTYTHGHSENVMNFAENIAREMELEEKLIGVVRDGALLHDIGKIGIPGYILNKQGPLTYEEFNGIMKTHSTLGANIVKDVPFLQELYSLILHHHEHYDGTGYPEGLSGEKIPLGARILHVADAFEAMTSNRPYRNSLGNEEALRRLKEGKRKQFDPMVVDAMLRIAQRKGWMHAAGAD